MKCLFIYNPCSGRGKINKDIKYIQKILMEKYGNVSIKASSSAGELSKFASEACGEYDVLFFAGGDGSFNEVLNGCAEKEKRPVLGYLPTGTVNDIARTLKISRRSHRKAIKQIIDGNIRHLDVMKVNDKYAEYEISAGALTSCSYRAPRRGKKAFGKIAYAVEILRNNMRLEDFNIKIEAEDKVIETNCEFVVFLNTCSMGSRPVNTKAILDDGEVELLVVKQAPKPRWYHKIAAFFHVIHFFAFGYNKSNTNCFEKYKGSHFIIDAPETLTWNYDGEEGDKGNIEITVLRNHIEVLVPKKGK